MNYASSSDVSIESINAVKWRLPECPGPEVAIVTYEIWEELKRQLPPESDPWDSAPVRLRGIPIERYPTRDEAADRARELAVKGIRVALVTSVGTVPKADQ